MHVVCVLKTGFCGKQTGSLRTVYGLKSPHDSVPYAIHVCIYMFIVIREVTGKLVWKVKCHIKSLLVYIFTCFVLYRKLVVDILIVKHMEMINK